MTQPLISVIMPTYNVEAFVEEAIGSVLAQDYPYLELLVVDDGSTDNTWPLVQRLAAQDLRIKTFQITPVGSASGPRNHGMQHAQGELIGFLDADDVLEPTALTTLAHSLRQQPQAKAAHGFYQIIDTQSSPKPAHASPFVQASSHGRPVVEPDYAFSWPRLLRGQVVVTQSTYLYRREALLANGGFNVAMAVGEDYEFCLRFHLLHGLGAIVPVHAFVLRYRHNPSSITKDAKRAQAMLKSHLCVWNSLFARQDLPSEVIQELGAAFAYGFLAHARVRLAQQQPQLARPILQAGLRHPRLGLGQKISLVPALMLSYLPGWVSGGIRKMVQKGKQFRARGFDKRTPATTIGTL